jgi:hypothetical protein
MTNPTVSLWSNSLRRTEVPKSRAIHRSGHGSTAWTLEPGINTLRQPQDGGTDTRARIASIDAHVHSNSMREPEDANLTGGTRSLMRRVMGLNVILPGRKAPRAATLATANVRVA